MLQWQQVSGCPAQMMDKDVANGPLTAGDCFQRSGLVGSTSDCDDERQMTHIFSSGLKSFKIS